MALQIEPNMNTNIRVFNESLLEQILLKISDIYNIRVIWDYEATTLATTLAIAGGIIGAFVGGRLGAGIGAGIGGAAGFSTSKVVPLREIWEQVKELLKDVLHILYEYLKTFEVSDYIRAYEIFIACSSNTKKQFIMELTEFIGNHLSRQILTSF